jgi:DNA-binding winged helix-turn-helix (wHTH) protein
METTLVDVVGSPEAPRAPASRQSAAVQPGDLRIDGWLVQPTLNLLSRDEVSVRLRAQLMDLLLCLAGRPGKVFGREELVTEVWEGRIIAESALSRCVAELRSALGDDAHRPRVIETITKRGYRLIAPVEPVTAPDTAAAATPPPAAIGAARNVVGHGRPGTPLSLWQRLKRAARPAGGTPGV